MTTPSGISHPLDIQVLKSWLLGIRSQLDLHAGVLRASGGAEINVYSFPGDWADSDHDYADAGIEAVFSGGDNVALSVDLKGLKSTPRVYASVVWGDPYGDCERSTFEKRHADSDWPIATHEALTFVERELPSLINALSLAIKRGRPPDP